MQRLLFLLTVFISLQSGYSQKNIEVKGSFVYHVPEHVSITEAKVIAIENAKYVALENAFGINIEDVTVSQVNSNSMNGAESISSNFNSYAQSKVKGEWLKTIAHPTIKKTWEKEQVVIEATVEGLARSFTESRPLFNYQVLSCLTKDKCQTETLNNEQKFYLFFQSPVSGNLSVYWEVPNEKAVYRILPTSTNLGYSIPVEADKPYYFFDPKNSLEAQEMQVELLVPTQSELNKLIILFSPFDSKTKPITDNQKVKQKANTLRPPKVEINEFNEWLFETRTDNPVVQVESGYIQIIPYK